jgi:uncharacterized membrane protein
VPRPTLASVPPRWVLPALVAVGAVLRIWRATTNGLTFDETYTALVGRRSFGELLSYLRRTDLHPPLDYLLRAPLARAGASDLLLRSPSLVFSCAALALFAWWMRSRGWVGVMATALMAVNAFQLLYGGEARMYALLELLGVAAAVVAERWLRRPERWHALVVGGVLLVALFDHVSGFLMAAGLLAVAGARRDREAWRWRVALVVPALVWAVAWGPAFLEQRRVGYAEWIARTTVGGLADVVTRQLTITDSLAPVVFAAVLAGGACLWRRERTLARVWLCGGALPFALAAVIGLFTGFLIERALTVASWAPPLALAFLLDALVRRWRTAGTALAVGTIVLTLTVSLTYFGVRKWDYDLSVGRLQQVAEPGDAIAVRPARYGMLVDWRIGVRGNRPTRHVHVDGLPDADVLLVGGARDTGRIWLLTPVGGRTRFTGFGRCAPRWTDHVTEVLCLRRSP